MRTCSVDQYVRDTSMEAYSMLKENGALGEMQTRVAYLIATNPDNTDRELSVLYFKSWGDPDPNAVRPRRHELMEQGWVIESGHRQCRITGRIALTWRLTVKKSQMELF